ncbi:MAG: hypothetical protein ACU841_03815 [Gammaproteobacteria bacterium]
MTVSQASRHFIPDRLSMPDIAGTPVSIDATDGQRRIALNKGDL